MAHGERGEGKIGAVIALLVVALMVHLGMEFIPYKIQTNEFEHEIEEGLKELAANLKKQDDFLLEIVEYAELHEIAVREDEIFLELSGQTWTFKTEYDVTLGMVWGDWVQHVEIERKRDKL
jgi:hypothetical protein